MKIKILIAGLLLSTSIASFAQVAIDILKKSYNKCQSVQNGYYEMTTYMKYMSSKDTSKSSFTCYFKKLKDDSLYSSAFHYYTFWNDTNRFDVMYTGYDFVTYFSKDSTATIMSKSLWANDIKSYRHNYKFYSPLTDQKSSPMPYNPTCPRLQRG